MARIRSVKPELRTSLTAADWPREVRYFWVLLWGYLDDHGYGVDEPRLIKADCFPLDDDLTAADIDDWLDIIAATGSLCRYRVAGKKYLHAPKWGDHQKPQHPKDTKIPPCTRGDCGEPSCDLHEDPCKPHESLSGNDSWDTPITSPVRNGGIGDGDGDGTSEPGTPETSSPGENARDDVERLCTHLADRIVANGSKRPTIGKGWREAARLMLDLDKRPEEKIHKAIDWCQDDEFWRANIMSMPKLRDQYDQIRLQARRGGPNARSPNGQHLRPRQPTGPIKDTWMDDR